MRTLQLYVARQFGANMGLMLLAFVSMLQLLDLLANSDDIIKLHGPSVGAFAVGMAEGPEVALAIVDRLTLEPALKSYHLLPSVRGDLLFKLGRYEEARAAFETAAALAGNKRELDLLKRRAAEAADAAAPS